VELKDKITHWTTGNKEGIGTALSDSSHIYFTIGRGRLTETYFPSPDNIVLHSVTLFLNGKIDESLLPHKVEILDDSSPLYKVFSREIEKEIIINPDNDTLLIQYKIPHLYAKNVLKIVPTSLKDAKRIDKNIVALRTKKTFLFVYIDAPFIVERVDNFLLLHLSLSKNKFTVTIAFGESMNEAKCALKKTKLQSFKDITRHYIESWKKYLGSLNLSGKSELYKRSIIAVKSMEDKHFKGATVASLAIPWGSKTLLSEKNGYHLVWVRDLFFVAFAMYLAGDNGFANSALEYMLSKLERNDGSFKQNATVKGEERWNATQMDQIAFPIILANRLGRNDLLGELGKAANYILSNGPWSEQERWEEIAGFSSYAMSLQARALSVYADMREKLGLSGNIYRRGAKEFTKLIPEYCYTRKGVFPPYSYFVRVSNGNPDTDRKEMFLKGRYFSPKEMISTDFLYLVFTGLYLVEHPFIKNSIEVVDNVLRVNTPKGPSFYRYNGDIYGFDNLTHPRGNLWSLLVIERGIIELIKNNNSNAQKYLTAIEKFATSTYQLSEQLFEDGTTTESSTPLAWSHAYYIIFYELFNNPTLLTQLYPLL